MLPIWQLINLNRNSDAIRGLGIEEGLKWLIERLEAGQK